MRRNANARRFLARTGGGRVVHPKHEAREFSSERKHREKNNAKRATRSFKSLVEIIMGEEEVKEEEGEEAVLGDFFEEVAKAEKECVKEEEEL